MVKGLQEDPESGLMNAETFLSTQRASGNSIMNVLYFRSTDYVHKWVKQGVHNR